MKKQVNRRVIALIAALLTFFGLSAQDLPEFTGVQRLDFNTSAEEAKPVFGINGGQMFFVRAYHEENVGYQSANHNEDIWQVERDAEGKWSNASNQGTINDEQNNSVIGYTNSGNFYLLNTYQDKKKLKCGIAKSSRSNSGQWTIPEIIAIPNLKYDGDFYDFYISPDEQVLLISIKGKDSKGLEDLYVSLNENGKWSFPQSLGDKINTAGYEFAPYLSKDKRFLYYSTNGRDDSYGDVDIYVSERIGEGWTNWSEPKNMGGVINSDKMDCYFTSNGEGEYFFSSNRDGKDLDIYQATDDPIPPVYTKEFVLKGVVKDSITGEAMSVNINITTKENNETVAKVKSDKDGNYEVELEKGNTYLVNILEKKYHEHHEEVTTPELETETKEQLYDIWMKPYKKGDEIKLDPLYFVVNTDSLRDISLPVVEKLATILIENPDIKISIEGHTSSDGLRHLNQELSERRAERIKDLLVERDIKKNRLKTVGYGQSRPKVKNSTEENRRLNRRVEFIILD